MNDKLKSLKDNEAEMQKCKESPLYFYNTYVLKDGMKKLTQEEYDRHVEMIKKQRNAIPLRMRRGNYAYMQPIEYSEATPESYEGEKIPDNYVADEFGQMGNVDFNVRELMPEIRKKPL